MRNALKAGGRVAIIAHEKPLDQGVKTHAVSPHDTVTMQMGYAGYKLVKQYDVLQRQYFIVFEKDPAYSPNSIIQNQEILGKSYLTTMIEDEESPQRDSWQKPEMVMTALGVKEGDTVADVGSGTGYFTFRLARKVGKAGKVYAVDNKQEFLDYIVEKAQKEEVKNIISIRSSNSDPKLSLSCCDVILMVDTYGSLYNPVEFMRNLRKALKPGARVAVISYNPGRVKSPFSVSKNEVVVQMKSVGYQLIQKYNFIDRQYYLVFN
jgi:precorrin-6B methylase 2